MAEDGTERHDDVDSEEINKHTLSAWQLPNEAQSVSLVSSEALTEISVSVEDQAEISITTEGKEKETLPLQPEAQAASPVSFEALPETSVPTEAQPDIEDEENEYDSGSSSKEEKNHDTQENPPRACTPPNPFCRICHDDRDDVGERNISPCDCKGTLSMVHLSCLQEWLATSGSSECELCGFQFTLRKKPKYSVPSSVWRWLTSQNSPQERRYIAMKATNLILDAPVVFAMNYLWFMKADSLLMFLEELMDAVLPYRKGYDYYNDLLAMLGQAANLMLICPLGILSGSSLMLYSFRMWDLIGNWYSWHKRQTDIVILQQDNEVTQ